MLVRLTGDDLVLLVGRTDPSVGSSRDADRRSWAVLAVVQIGDGGADAVREIGASCRQGLYHAGVREIPSTVARRRRLRRSVRGIRPRGRRCSPASPSLEISPIVMVLRFCRSWACRSSLLFELRIVPCPAFRPACSAHNSLPRWGDRGGGPETKELAPPRACPLRLIFGTQRPRRRTSASLSPRAAFRAMGWSDHSIAVEFGVTAQTIAKAIRWLRGRPGLQAG